MPKGQAPPPRPYGEQLSVVQARVLAKLEAGWTEDMVAAEPGFPARQTLYRWAKADPEGFGRRLVEARNWGKAIRFQGRMGSWAFDELKALAFLERVRGGAAVRALVREAGQPHRDLLNSWKRQRPDFARELEAAIREGRRARPGSWDCYDEAMADEILLRVMRGETMPDVLAGRANPGKAALRAWKRQRPDFAAALRRAQISGWRARRRGGEAVGTGRGRCTPAFMAKVEKHILAGGSLCSASRSVEGAPHAVTLYGWMKRKPEFREMVERAKVWRDEELRDAEYEAATAAAVGDVVGARRRVNAIRRRLGQLHGGRRPAWMGTLE